MSPLSRGVMAQKNNDSDQQTGIAIRQLQPPHTQAGSQTHRHATFSCQEKHKTFWFFSWANCWETLCRGQREPGCLGGEDAYLGWSAEPGKALEGAAARGLTLTIHSGMAKPWLVPAEPGLEACGQRDLTSLLPSCHRAQETLLGCQAGSPWQSSESSAAFPPLSPSPSEDDVALPRQMGAQPQHPCPAASSAASSSSRSPRCPGGSAHRPPLSGTAHPRPAAFPSSFSTSRLQLPPPSADRAARSRTAPFSPGERKNPGARPRRG